MIQDILLNIITPRKANDWRWELKNKILRICGVQIGNKVAIDRGFNFLSGAGSIEIQDYAAIGRNARFYHYGKIIIGRYCMIAGEVIFANGGHEKETFTPFSGTLEVGNGCWIGIGAQIVGANIKIGDNSIIGAGALVIRDVSEGSVVAGCPAKIIGQRSCAKKIWHFGDEYFSPVTFDKV